MIFILCSRNCLWLCLFAIMHASPYTKTTHTQLIQLLVKRCLVRKVAAISTWHKEVITPYKKENALPILRNSSRIQPSETTFCSWSKRHNSSTPIADTSSTPTCTSLLPVLVQLANIFERACMKHTIEKLLNLGNCYLDQRYWGKHEQFNTI